MVLLDQAKQRCRIKVGTADDRHLAARSLILAQAAKRVQENIRTLIVFKLTELKNMKATVIPNRLIRRRICRWTEQPMDDPIDTIRRKTARQKMLFGNFVVDDPAIAASNRQHVAETQEQRAGAVIGIAVVNGEDDGCQATDYRHEEGIDDRERKPLKMNDIGL